MLGSTAESAYINPEYLQPLPTTLDSKNSPLALLAQTCSSIGKDSSTLIPSLEKKVAKSESPAHSSSASSSASSSSGGRTMTTERKSPPTRSSRVSSSSPKANNTPPRRTPPQSSHHRKSIETPESRRSESSPKPVPSSVSLAPSIKSDVLLGSVPSSFAPPLYPGAIPLLGGFSEHFHTSALLAQSAAAAAAFSKPPLFPPYPRLKGSPPTSLCKDSFCASCPGCDKTPSYSLSPLSMSPYAHPYYGLVSSVPLVCNWSAPGEYCGKRFMSSEELLHHLRSHTESPYSQAAAALQLSNSHLSPSRTPPSRFHPYKSPITPPVPSLSSPLNPYMSPYAALYSQRLGPPVAP